MDAQRRGLRGEKALRNDLPAPAYRLLTSGLPVRTHERRGPARAPAVRQSEIQKKGGLPDWKLKRMQELDDEGMPRTHIAAALGVGEVTVWRRLGRRKA